MTLLALLLSALPAIAQTEAPATTQSGDDGVVFPASASQGALVFGKVPAGSVVRYAERELRPTPYGTVVFGVDRQEVGPLRLEVLRTNGTTTIETIAVDARLAAGTRRWRAAEDGKPAAGDCRAHPPRTGPGH